MDLVEEIGRGAHTVVFRATRAGETYAVKVRLDNFARPGVDLQFRREAAMLACLDHPGLPKIIEVNECDGRPYVVMEHVPGRTLAETLDDGPLDEPTIIHLAQGIAGALAVVHRRGLVHRDVKPQNILIDTRGNAKVIDFGFAARIGGGSAQDHVVVGTFLYSSPEQAGMLKRPIDGRSDLYSLGVVLYECATGGTPFQASDVAELIRQHAVQAPRDLRKVRPEISPVLAAIIHKLIAKDPDDRYQSGEGLLADLTDLAALQLNISRGKANVLGRSDQGAPKLFEMPLVSRESELARMVHQWNEVRRGAGSVVLVDGPPGAGKSRLVREFLGRVQGALHLRAKCGEGDPMPFAPIRQALDLLIGELSRSDAPSSRITLGQIHEACGDLAPLVKRFSAVLGRLFEDAPDPPANSDLQGLFYDAIAEFILRIAHSQQDGLLFIDDVQWIDDASREILLRLVEKLRGFPLMIMLTARSDPDSRPVLDAVVDDLGQVPLLRLSLSALDDNAVTELITAHLGGSAVEDAFVQQIITRSDGSPFAVGEYLRAMLDSGVLRPSWGRWLVDSTGLKTLALPRDVVQLIVHRVNDLGEETKQVLQAAAVMGQRFDVGLLPAVVPDVESVCDAIVEATRAHLIEQELSSDYVFVHDRVREALLLNLDEERRREYHQQIAEVLEPVDESDDEQVYAIARHYALGNTDQSPKRAYETNLAAGLRAAEKFANEDALSFLQQAASLIGPAGVGNDSTLDDALARVCAATRRFVDAEVYIARAIGYSTDTLFRANLWRRLSEIHTAKMDLTPAWEALEKAFGELGLSAPSGRIGKLIGVICGWLLRMPMRRWKIRHGTAPGTEEFHRLAIVAELYEDASFIAFFRNQDLLMFEAALASLKLTNRLGPSRQVVNVYCNYAALLAMLGRGRRADHYTTRSVAIAQEIGDRSSMARAYLFRAWCKDFSGLHREAETLSRRCLQDYEHWLEGIDYVNGTIELAWNLQMRGYTREAWRWIQRCMAKTKYKIGADEDHDHPHGFDYAGSLLATMGRPTEAMGYLEHNDAFLAAHPESVYPRAELLTHKIIFHLEQGELDSGIDALVADHEKLGITPGRSPMFLRHFFIVMVYVWAARCEKSCGAHRAANLEKLTHAVRQLKKAAMVPIIAAHAKIGQGIVARYRGKPALARKWFRQAAVLARDADSPWAVFEIAVQRGQLLLAEDNPGAANREARFAHAIAVDQGWTQRARRVRTIFQTVTASNEHSGVLRHEVADSASVKLRRHLDALMQVSMASANVLDPDVQARVALDEIVRILGAERAFLFWIDNERQELELKAGRDADGKSLSELKGYSSTVVSRVRTTGEPLIVSGTEEGAVLGSESAVVYDLRSILAVPLQIRDRLVGVIYLDNRLAKGIFTEEDVEILLAIGGHIAIAQDTARTAALEIKYESERQQRRLAEILRDLSIALNSTLNLNDVLTRLLESLAQVIPYDRAMGLLRQDDGFRVLSSAGYVEPMKLKRLVIDQDADPYFSEMARHKRPLIVTDAQAETKFDGYGPADGLRSWIGIPLISNRDMVGAVILAKREAGRYDTSEADIAAAFAGQAVIAIENARLFGEVQRLAITDELTGTHNRRNFFTLAEREYARALRYNRPLSVIMIDIDHFKAINDDHGHATGDVVLREVAQRCQGSLRDLDVLGRYGGEEFVVLLPEIGAKIAHEVVAERLRKCVADDPAPTDRGPISVTISLGVACLEPEMKSFNELVQKADRALYEAKTAGRNRSTRH